MASSIEQTFVVRSAAGSLASSRTINAIGIDPNDAYGIGIITPMGHGAAYYSEPSVTFFQRYSEDQQVLLRDAYLRGEAVIHFWADVPDVTPVDGVLDSTPGEGGDGAITVTTQSIFASASDARVVFDP